MAGATAFPHNRLSFSETASTAENFLVNIFHCLSSTTYTKSAPITLDQKSQETVNERNKQFKPYLDP